jgi:hypothetical protein
MAMTGLHQHMALAQVRAGMVLSDELLDLQGKVLLPRGTVLSATMLAALQRHDIEALPIMLQATLSEQEVACALQQHRQRIAHLFRKNDPADQSDAATSTLRRLMLEFRLDTETPP